MIYLYTKKNQKTSSLLSLQWGQGLKWLTLSPKKPSPHSVYRHQSGNNLDKHKYQLSKQEHIEHHIPHTHAPKNNTHMTAVKPKTHMGWKFEIRRIYTHKSIKSMHTKLKNIELKFIYFFKNKFYS